MLNFFSRRFHSLLQFFRSTCRIQKQPSISPEQLRKLFIEMMSDPENRRIIYRSLIGTLLPIEGGLACSNTATYNSLSDGKLTKYTSSNGCLADSSVLDNYSGTAITIDSFGKVGIGSSPGELLTVSGSDAAILLTGEGTHALVVEGQHLGVITSAGRLGQDSTGFFFSSDTSGKVIKFLTTNSGGLHESLRIDQDGKVGIGTSTPGASLDVSPAHTVTSGVANWSAIRVVPTLTGSGTDAMVGTFTEMRAPTGHKTFMYGYDVNLFPGGEQTASDNDAYDVNGLNIENGGIYRAESGVSVGGGAEITNAGDNANKYTWVQALELSTSAEVGIWFGPGTGTATVNAGHPPFDVGIDMFLSSFNTCAIRLPNGIGNGIRGRNAANSADYRLIDIDASNNAVLGAESPVIQGAPPSAPADGDLNNSNISFYLDEGGKNLMVKAKYSTGAVKTGTVCSLTP